MRIGFTVTRRMRDIEAQIFMPDFNQQPALISWAQKEGDFAVLMGRLYYQQDILNRLLLQCSHEWLNKYRSNDAALALIAYRNLGAASLGYLEGDFSLVLWDAEHSCLIGLRDPMGGYPLFWAEHARMYTFSTSIRPLLDLRAQRALNFEYFAEFLMMPAPRQEGASEACAYTGIQRVLPGTIVTIENSAKGAKCYRYWDWLHQLHDPGTDNLAEIAEQYRNLLRAGIRERMRGRITADLSGGMDSTSVALLAQDLVHSGIGEAPLHTLSLVYERLPGLAHERPYIEGVLQHEPEIVAHRLVADDLVDYTHFVDLPLHEEPYGGVRTQARDQTAFNVAAQIGAVTMLTGIGSDEIHDVRPYYLLDLLRRGRLFNAWQEAGKWASAGNCSPWTVLQRFGVIPFTSGWLLAKPGSTRLRRSPAQLNKQTDWTIPPWVVPAFAQRYALQSRAFVNMQQRYHRHQQTTLSMTLDALVNRPGDVLRWIVAAPLGITITHPFLDGRLLSFGLGLQLRLQPEPGQIKPVLATAMRNVLPDNIRNRRRKEHAMELYYLGLTRNLPQLEMLIHQAPQETWEMFDKDVLLRCLQEASFASTNARQVQRLDYTLALIKWLSMQDEYQPAKSSPTEIIRLPLGVEPRIDR